MSHSIEQLWAAYGEWKALTEQEGLAINAADWPRVQTIQDKKHSLQTEIIRLTEQVQHEFSTALDHRSFDARLRTIVNELILLETQNNVNLQASLDRAREQKNSLEATSSRLRQLHNSYVRSRPPVWENRS